MTWTCLFGVMLACALYTEHVQSCLRGWHRMLYLDNISFHAWFPEKGKLIYSAQYKPGGLIGHWCCSFEANQHQRSTAHCSSFSHWSARSLYFLQMVQFKRLTHRFPPAISVSQPSHVTVLHSRSKSCLHFSYVEYVTFRFLDSRPSSVVLLVAALFILPEELAKVDSEKTLGQMADHVVNCTVILI